MTLARNIVSGVAATLARNIVSGVAAILCQGIFSKPKNYFLNIVWLIPSRAIIIMKVLIFHC